MNNNWMVPSQSRLFSALETYTTSRKAKQLRNFPVGNDLHPEGTQAEYKRSYRHWDETPLDCEAYLSWVDRGDFD